MAEAKFKTVVLKLSGEALAGEDGFGINQDMLNHLAEEVKSVKELGCKVMVVIGGGNIWRGIAGSKRGMERTTADYMGMLATVMNSLALQSTLEEKGIPTRVMSAIHMIQVAEPYVYRNAAEHLEQGRVVIFSAGTGNPYFSTDSAAALRAAEFHADAILMAKKVDGVYSDDPKTNPDAIKYDELTFTQVLEQDLKVMDSTAASMCRDNHIPICVFNINVPGNAKRAAMGENVGTIVGGEFHD